MTRYAYSREDQGDLNNSGLTSARNRKHIDIDLSFTAKSTTGDIFKKTEIAAVKQSVKNLLMTNRMEKPFVADYGADIVGMLFELADGESDYFLKKQIVTTIQKYEPRARVMNLVVKADPDYNRLGVKIEFKLKATGEVAEFSTTLRRLR